MNTRDKNIDQQNGHRNTKDGDQGENASNQDKQRKSYIIESTIDGRNCDIHPEELRKEKEALDKNYAQVLEELNQERTNQLKHYEKETKQIREDDRYKEEIYEAKIKQLMEEKAREDRLYEEKVEKLRNDMNFAVNSLQEKVERLNRERDVQLQIIEDNIAEVRQEKAKYDELYGIQLEKIKQDRQYEQNLEQVKESRKENQELHHSRQDQLLKEKEYRHSDFAKSMERERNAALVRLNEMENYAVADEDPDVRGWQVLNRNNNVVGNVEELIVDKDAMKVRYLDIDLDNNFLDNGRERHLLLPIGVAAVDAENKTVVVTGIDRNIVSKIPPYDGNQVTRGYEETLLNVLSPENDTSGRTEADFYERADFDTKNFYSNRK